MSAAPHDALKQRLAEHTGVKVLELNPLKNSSLSENFSAQMADGQQLLIKTQLAKKRACLRAEADGLRWLLPLLLGGL